MATPNCSGPNSAANPSQGGVTPSPKPGPFFKFNATYFAAPGTTLVSLTDDTACLFDACLGVLDAASEWCDEVGRPELWAAVYLLRQIRGNFNTIRDRAYSLQGFKQATISDAVTLAQPVELEADHGAR